MDTRAAGAVKALKSGQPTSLKDFQVNNWPVQDAKARFSEFLEACVSQGPQMVTKRGAEAAVLVPVDEWRRLNANARPSLKDLLLDASARTDLLVPPRGTHRRRRSASFE